MKIPLPSSRTSIPDDDPLAAVAREVLEPFGLAWTDLRVRHLKNQLDRTLAYLAEVETASRVITP